jgi:hypothetical protein
MAEKIVVYPETLSCGGIEFEIKVKDQSLLERKRLFQSNEK